jgi:hypothetical protein
MTISHLPFEKLPFVKSEQKAQFRSEVHTSEGDDGQRQVLRADKFSRILRASWCASLVDLKAGS